MANCEVFEKIGMFVKKFRNFVYGLADAKKGEYLINIETIFSQNVLRNKLNYILRGMAFCKIVGWKNIVYQTRDPFLMLKLGANIFHVLSNSATVTKTLQNEQKNQDCLQRLNVSQNDQKLSLQKVTCNSFSYVMIFRMETMRFEYEITFKQVSQQNLEYLNDFSNYQSDESNEKKIRVLPRF